MLDDESRFWEKVNRNTEEGCWLWKATKHPDGHGKISVDGEYEYAHRVSYSLQKKDPRDELVLHKCGNPGCVNPDHLYLGNHSDNIRDAYERGERDVPLTKEDVVEIKRKLEYSDKTQREIAEEYGVVRGTIGNIATGRNWSQVELPSEDDAS